MLFGPEVLLPWGLVLYTFIGAIILVILGEILWNVFKHYPEDEYSFSEGNTFVIESDVEDEEGKS